MLTDIVLGLLLYLFIRSKTKEWIALLASAWYLFAPPVLYNSTIWGQMDAINNLFFFVSVVALTKKQTFLSIFFLALSLYVKLSLAPFVPLFLFIGFLGKYFKLKPFVVSVVASAIIIYIINIPFSLNPFWLIGIIKMASVGISQDITVNAYNFWWLVYKNTSATFLPVANDIFLGMKLEKIGYLLFAAASVPLFLFVAKAYRKKFLNERVIFFVLGLAAYAGFLFLPKMHERYLYPVFPLFITWMGLPNSSWISVFFLGLLHFFNLYIVWNPNLFLFRNFEPFIVTGSVSWCVSAATVLLFFCFLVMMWSFQFEKPKKK